MMCEVVIVMVGGVTPGSLSCHVPLSEKVSPALSRLPVLPSMHLPPAH